MRQLAAVVLFSPLALSGFPATGETLTPAPAFRAAAAEAAPANAQLPPEIQVDRHLLRLERLLAADDPAGALEAMHESFTSRPPVFARSSEPWCASTR